MPLSFFKVEFFIKVSKFAIVISRNDKKLVVIRENQNFQICRVFSRNAKFLKKPMTYTVPDIGKNPHEFVWFRMISYEIVIFRMNSYDFVWFRTNSYQNLRFFINSYEFIRIHTNLSLDKWKKFNGWIKDRIDGWMNEWINDWMNDGSWMDR